MAYIIECGMTTVAKDSLADAVRFAATYCRQASIVDARKSRGDWRGERRPVAHVEDGKVTARRGMAWPSEMEASVLAGL